MQSATALAQQLQLLGTFGALYHARHIWGPYEPQKNQITRIEHGNVQAFGMLRFEARERSATNLCLLWDGKLYAHIIQRGFMVFASMNLLDLRQYRFPLAYRLPKPIARLYASQHILAVFKHWSRKIKCDRIVRPLGTRLSVYERENATLNCLLTAAVRDLT